MGGFYKYSYWNIFIKILFIGRLVGNKMTHETNFRIMNEDEVKDHILQDAKRGDIFGNDHGYHYPFIYTIDVEADTYESNGLPLVFFARIGIYVRPVDLDRPISSTYATYDIRIPPIREYLGFNEYDGITRENRKRYDVPDLFVDEVWFSLNFLSPNEVTPRAKILRGVLPDIVKGINKHKPLRRTEKVLDALVEILE